LLRASQPQRRLHWIVIHPCNVSDAELPAAVQQPATATAPTKYIPTTSASCTLDPTMMLDHQAKVEGKHDRGNHRPRPLTHGMSTKQSDLLQP
jgi:hypothetical protein